jgi:hypothetical protein
VKFKVYIETTIPSYLTAWRSRDLVTAGNQVTTKEFWDRRQDFEFFISQFVIDEALSGDPTAASERIEALSGIPELGIVSQIFDIANKLLQETALPAKARVDALHISTAAWHGMDYLLTWNCTHIANPAARPKIEAVIKSFGFVPPIICTPQELLEV